MTSVDEAKIALRIAELETELVAARDTLAKAVATRLAAAESEVAALRGDYDALRAEYALVNEELSLRSAELLQARTEKETAEAAAAAAALEVRQLKGELERLQGSQPAPAPVGISPAAPADDGSSGWLGRAAAASEGEVSFQPDHSLTAIPCASADDIIDLRVSINAIRISTDHTGVPHKCSAYICGIRRNGGKEVFVALHQLDTDRSIIYQPSRQPVDQADYERITESAVAFADITGFIINFVYLGGSAEDRAEAIQQIPVFGKR